MTRRCEARRDCRNSRSLGSSHVAAAAMCPAPVGESTADVDILGALARSDLHQLSDFLRHVNMECVSGLMSRLQHPHALDFLDDKSRRLHRLALERQVGNGLDRVMSTTHMSPTWRLRPARRTSWQCRPLKAELLVDAELRSLMSLEGRRHHAWSRRLPGYRRAQGPPSGFRPI